MARHQVFPRAKSHVRDAKRENAVEQAASERARAYYADRDPGRVKDISAFHERAKYEGGPQNAWQFGQVLGAANARSTQAKNCV
jgi:hypothetical protein